MNFRVTAIMLAVLAVLGATVWFTEFREKRDAEATSTAKPQPEIFKFEEKDTRQIEVLKGDQKIQAEKDEQGEWTLQPAGLAGDRVRITSVLFRLASLQANRRVADQPADFAQYGLDNPTVTATVTQADGTTYVLEAGSKAPSESVTYVKKADEPSVFLVPNQLVTDLERLVAEPPIQRPTPTPMPTPEPSPNPTPGS